MGRGGAGRKRVTESDPALIVVLEVLLESLTRGNPMSPLLWTCKSRRRLATELTAPGHRGGYRTVAWLLHEAGYSLQANRKPLASVQVIVNLIAATRTRKGLIVKAALDEARYEPGITVTDDQLARVNIKPAQFHGEWNYTIKPNSTTM